MFKYIYIYIFFFIYFFLLLLLFYIYLYIWKIIGIIYFFGTNMLKYKTKNGIIKYFSFCMLLKNVGDGATCLTDQLAEG